MTILLRIFEIVVYSISGYVCRYGGKKLKGGSVCFLKDIEKLWVAEIRPLKSAQFEIPDQVFSQVRKAASGDFLNTESKSVYCR